MKWSIIARSTACSGSVPENSEAYCSATASYVERTSSVSASRCTTAVSLPAATRHKWEQLATTNVVVGSVRARS
jgi:hypothetical protein